MGGFAFRFFSFLYPDVPPERLVEIPVAKVDQVPKGGGIVVHLPAGHIALEEANGEIRAFSAVCTHLGCIVKWQPAMNHVWFCECHRGMYDREGRVVGGPPPRPLERYPVEVRDGRVFVKLKIRPPGLAA